MWAANAATVTSSIDSLDEVIHITPANLMSDFHRSIEVPYTYQQLKTIFNAPQFRVHEPTPALAHLSDEGDANHMRLTPLHSKKGVNVFVYGKGGHGLRGSPQKYPARQSLAACTMIAQRHRINTHVLFFQQNPDAIDAGIFHNDVAAMSNESVLIYHEDAFLEGKIGQQIAAHCDFVLDCFEVSPDEMTLQEAVESYFFNSQLVSVGRNRMALVMPMECKDHPAVERILPRIVNIYGQVQSAHYVDCRQSMQNGGGPACLRLRVPMTAEELAAVNPAYLLNHAKIDRIEAWVNQYYRDRLAITDFLDPEFRRSCFEALEALEKIL
jgi:succinylarginine dihydrolase